MILTTKKRRTNRDVASGLGVDSVSWFCFLSSLSSIWSFGLHHGKWFNRLSQVKIQHLPIKWPKQMHSERSWGVISWLKYVSFFQNMDILLNLNHTPWSNKITWTDEVTSFRSSSISVFHGSEPTRVDNLEDRWSRPNCEKPDRSKEKEGMAPNRQNRNMLNMRKSHWNVDSQKLIYHGDSWCFL